MRQTERPRAVSTWRFLRVARTLGILSCLLWCGMLGIALPARSDDAAARRALAKAQFAHAEKLRAALEAKTERERSIDDYAKLASAYRRVYLITPHAIEVPEALYQVGKIYQKMGEQFGPKFFDSSVEAYEFLLHEYPTNRYREEALLAIADIQWNDLGEPNLAEETYKDFLKRYPHSEHADEARQALAEMQGADRLFTHDSLPSMPVSTVPLMPEEKPSDNSSDHSSEVSRIRVWNADTFTRIVIDLGAQAKYQAARIFNPDRIYFDIDAARLSPELRNQPIDVPGGGYLKSVRVAQNRPGVVRVVLDVAKVKDYSVFELANPDRLVVDVYGPDAGTHSVLGPPSLKGQKTAAQTARSRKALGPGLPELPARNAAEALGPPPVPQPMHDGEQSLSRALGLKVSRIVIDAGHGGHDTGTIGPGGMMEKTLCLDLALRLGRLIHKHLPGAEVIYTRKNDSFVPLEERTAIANEANADLFISIHANSSSDPKVSGIETYYLNFNASPEAMEVAARENALAQNSVHQLQDLIRKIARNDKVEESRDLATDVQEGLTKEIASSRFGHDRGVRKAPFVVLIGANMPSILAEVSFLSNPRDEQWLKKPRDRQKIAEGLYRGIESYLEQTNSLAMNLQPGTSVRGSPTAVARSSKPQ
jgi:N-acetylmuramoyl-L-alanine amidase